MGLQPPPYIPDDKIKDVELVYTEGKNGLEGTVKYVDKITGEEITDNTYKEDK